MDNPQTISRRGALIGALVSGAVLTLPAAAIADPRWAPSMSLAIEAHRKAMGAFDAALDQCERVEAAAPAQPDCRVQVASMINGNHDGSNRPIYRSSVDEARLICDATGGKAGATRYSMERPRWHVSRLRDSMRRRS